MAAFRADHARFAIICQPDEVCDRPTIPVTWYRSSFQVPSAGADMGCTRSSISGGSCGVDPPIATACWGYATLIRS